MKSTWKYRGYIIKERHTPFNVFFDIFKDKKRVHSSGCLDFAKKDIDREIIAKLLGMPKKRLIAKRLDLIKSSVNVLKLWITIECICD